LIKYAGLKYEMFIIRCSSRLLVNGVDLHNVVSSALTRVSLTRKAITRNVGY